MKRFSVILLIAIMLAGGAVAAVSTPSQAQGYNYPPPPSDPYAYPWVGPSTPWVYYNGDWFLNGLLYLFFGPQYGWAPYYAYPYDFIVRPPEYYAPIYVQYYRTNPVIIERFVQTYPYWRGHHQGQRYDERFFEQHHRGQGGWQQGFHGKPPAPGAGRGAPAAKPGPSRVAPEREKPAPSRVAPSEREKPGPGRVAPSERQKPAPAAPSERREPGPARMTPPGEQKPGPARVAPPAGPQPAPAHVAPPAGPKPAPAPAPKAAPKPAPAPKPEGAAPAPPAGGLGGEEKH